MSVTSTTGPNDKTAMIEPLDTALRQVRASRKELEGARSSQLSKRLHSR